MAAPYNLSFLLSTPPVFNPSDPVLCCHPTFLMPLPVREAVLLFKSLVLISRASICSEIMHSICEVWIFYFFQPVVHLALLALLLSDQR
jgi:hypothetical protein